MRRDDEESGTIIAYIAGLLIIVLLGFFSIHVMQHRQELCEAKGGSYHFDRSGGICLRKDAVIKP